MRPSPANVTESAQIDQASQTAARALIPPTARLCCLTPSVTTPLYRTTVSKALRSALRGSSIWVNFNHASEMYR
jgi:hypothetical protein